MADPISATLLVAGAATGALSDIQQGRAAEKAGKQQARIEGVNAELARRAGRREAERRRRIGRKVEGTQVARAGASGVQVSGSVAEVIGESIEQSESAALEALFKGEVEAFGAETRGQFAKFKGKQAKKAGTQKAVGTILSSAGQGFAPGGPFLG